MKDYKLDNTKLIVLQGMNNEAVDISSIRAMVMEDFYKNSEQRLVEQKQKIATLEQNLERYKPSMNWARRLSGTESALPVGKDCINISCD